MGDIHRLAAEPNPVAAANEVGRVVLSWTSAAEKVEIRVGAPDGPLFSASGPTGRAETGAWVHNGMTFYMQDVSRGQELTPEHTLARVTVRVVGGGTTATFPRRQLQEVRRCIRTARFHVRRGLRRTKLASLPIRIIFLAQDPLDWWSLDSVYRACASDDRFTAIVVSTPFHDPERGYSTDSGELLAGRGIPFLDGVSAPVNIDRLRPDVIALSSPYDQYRGAGYLTSELLRCGKVIYIPYCIDCADENGHAAPYVYGLDLHRRAWRLFSRSERTRGQYLKYGVDPTRLVFLGHPRLDHYHSDSSAELLPRRLLEASAGKFRIIYAPHYTLEGWSTFLAYRDTIRRLIDRYDDCYLVFRPHPFLMSAVERANVMSAAEFRALFEGDRCCVYDGREYYALFRWSDLLISDGSSFLVEYAPTRKPVVYLSREDGWGGLDASFEDDVLGSCYVARSAADIERLVADIRNGIDPLRGTRAGFQENMSVGMFAGGAGERIASYLAAELG